MQMRGLNNSVHLTPRSRFANWKPVTVSEMEGFFRVIINMGLIQLLNWSSSCIGKIPFFGRAFQRNRFEQIFWMLHVSKDDPLQPGKKLNKVKYVLDILIPNFQWAFSPTRNLSVDETMIGFHGRFSSKQYMLAKPFKYGIKAFTLANSTHGYMPCLYRGRHT